MTNSNKMWELQGSWPKVSGNPARGTFTSEQIAKEWAEELGISYKELENPTSDDVFFADILLY